MAQDKKKKGTAKDLMLPTPEMSGDPMLAGTGQPGELANTPTTPDSTFAQEKAMQEQGIEQDPALQGTGQPGELYGAPQTPSDEWLQEMEKPDVHDEARDEVATMLAPDFKGGWWMKSLDERFDFVKILNRTSDKDDGGLQ